jgi:hypothetical protein
MRPAFAAPYSGDSYGAKPTPPVEDTLTTGTPARRRIGSSTSCVASIGARRLQVERRAPLQRRGVRVVRRRPPAAGVVDQDVDPAVALLGEGDHVLQVAVDAHVGAHEAPRAAAFEIAATAASPGDIRDVGDHHRRAPRRPAAARSTSRRPVAPPVTIATRPRAPPRC